MKKLKTLRVEEDLLRQMEAIEPNFNKAAVDAFEAYVGPHGNSIKGNGGRADTRPVRGRVGETGESRAAEVPRRVGSSPTSPAKLEMVETSNRLMAEDLRKELATSAVTAIGETVTPAADLRYARPAHDPRTCRNPFCLVCKKNDA